MGSIRFLAWRDIASRERMQWLLAVPILLALAIILWRWTFGDKWKLAGWASRNKPNIDKKVLVEVCDQISIDMESRLVAMSKLDKSDIASATEVLGVNFGNVMAFNAELAANKYALCLGIVFGSAKDSNFYPSFKQINTGEIYMELRDHFLLKPPKHQGLPKLEGNDEVANKINAMLDEGRMMSLDEFNVTEKVAEAIPKLIAEQHLKPITPLVQMINKHGFKDAENSEKFYLEIDNWMSMDLERIEKHCAL